METLGAFGMTEPDSGSDVMAIKTVFRRSADGGYVLNGQKRWIGNASIAGVLFVVARDEDGTQLGLFVVENPLQAEGVDISVIRGKGAARALHNTMVTLRDVAVAESQRLPAFRSLRDVSRALRIGRLCHLLANGRRGSIVLGRRTCLYPEERTVRPAACQVSDEPRAARADGR
jgi:glutaryl-CoA dehydrogenase